TTLLLFGGLLLSAATSGELLRHIRRGQAAKAEAERHTLPPPLWRALRDQGTFLAEALWTYRNMQKAFEDFLQDAGRERPA
ncbi:hypothetical protein CSUI_000561, partial [Cystoisospora suis]